MPRSWGGAFIMSEITGISYFEIIKAAAIPAILYYLDFSCRPFYFPSPGMASIPASERPPFRSILRHSYYFSFPADRGFLRLWLFSSKSAFFVVLIIFG